MALAEADVQLRTTVDPDAVHSVIYTSGTTGEPKAVELTVRQPRRQRRRLGQLNLGVGPDDRWLCALPLFHVGGLASLLRSAIYGTTAVLHERLRRRAA